MKTLLLVRHAKTHQADIGEQDFDRKLTDRGKRNAVEIAAEVKKRKTRIDGFVSSPAKRAMQTCKLFCEVFEEKKDNIVYEQSLYEAPAVHYAKAVALINNHWDAVAVFGHNGGITDYANSLCHDVFTDNMPTSAVFVVSADVNNWQQFAGAAKTFVYFLQPDDLI